MLKLGTVSSRTYWATAGTARQWDPTTSQRRWINLSILPFKPYHLGLDKMRIPKSKLLEEEWTDLWPVARPYNHHLVRLPIRMGRPTYPGEPPREADGNAELLKIPNFLHLTPRHIEKHTQALKPLCKPWPKDFDISPRTVRVRTNNHLFPGASLRHPRSHVVQLKVQLRDIPNLDARAEKKLIALAGKRFIRKTRTISLVCKECPTREQNRDYALFQLLALWKEAQKKEDWEVTAETEDFTIYEL